MASSPATVISIIIIITTITTLALRGKKRFTGGKRRKSVFCEHYERG